MSRTGVTKVGWSTRVKCVEVIWTHGEDGGRAVGEEISRIQCKKCEVGRKAKNGMDGRCEKSVE